MGNSFMAKSFVGAIFMSERIARFLSPKDARNYGQSAVHQQLILLAGE